MNADLDSCRPRLLGIEGGGTRTVALLADDAGTLLQRLETGPTNLSLMTDDELADRFQQIARAFPAPHAIGIGLAGGWEETDWQRIRAAAGRAWPNLPCEVTNDLETALTAAAGSGAPNGIPQVLVISGTGSGCFGQNREGRAKIGGWGHILGDRGSGYDIGLQALRQTVDEYDRLGVWPKLGQKILGALLLNQPNDLISWAQAATKADIAALAKVVFQAWSDGDRLAVSLVRTAASQIAQSAAACADQLARRGKPVQFVLSGGLLMHQPRYANLVRRDLRKRWRNSIISTLAKESAWGAVELARRRLARQPSAERSKRAERSPAQPRPRSRRLSPTEQRNPASTKLDQLPLRNAIQLMLSEDARIPAKLLAQQARIGRAIRRIVRSLKTDGRLFYVGAGTSGRLGVLDASECPPTFSLSPDQVQGVIAGGFPALWQSIEGAEDDYAGGAHAIQFRGVTRRDTVVGIAASGTTPFVWGALAEAKRRAAGTILVCFNPYLQIPQPLRPDVVIDPNLGPEILTGSTRLKAGTATKLLLNLFSTLAMVQMGKVVSNLMVDVNPANDKLRERAIRIVCELTGADPRSAQARLERHGWVVKQAAA